MALVVSPRTDPSRGAVSMLEIADLKKKLDPAVYKRTFPKLQEKLRQLQ